MNDEKIFDLYNLDDLPDSLSAAMRRPAKGKNESMIMELFKIKKILSVDEIRIGLYRLYKIEKNSQWVQNNLQNIIFKKLIKKVDGKIATYERTN